MMDYIIPKMTWTKLSVSTDLQQLERRVDDAP